MAAATRNERFVVAAAKKKENLEEFVKIEGTCMRGFGSRCGNTTM